MSNQEVTKFEFLLTLEGNIICQRFFNVREHNPKSRRSMDLHYYVKNICDDICSDLKTKTLDYLHENRDYFYGLDAAETEEQKMQFIIVSYIV